jgi:hypothetical protein
MPDRPPADPGDDGVIKFSSRRSAVFRLTFSKTPSRLDELRDRVLHRDQVSAVLAVRLLDIRTGLIERGRELRARVRELSLQTKDLLDAFEVDAFVGQFLNTSKRR